MSVPRFPLKTVLDDLVEFTGAREPETLAEHDTDLTRADAYGISSSTFPISRVVRVGYDLFGLSLDYIAAHPSGMPRLSREELSGIEPGSFGQFVATPDSFMSLPARGVDDNIQKGSYGDLARLKRYVLEAFGPYVDPYSDAGDLLEEARDRFT